MPIFKKNANTSRYFFGNLLDMFFQIKMAVYSQVLNTFMLIYCLDERTYNFDKMQVKLFYEYKNR